MEIVRTQQEVEELLARAIEMAIGDEDNPFWGMSYAEGVEAGIRWLIGEQEENPLEE